MKIRIAKKIVKRYEQNPVVLLAGRTSRDQVSTAFRRLGMGAPVLPLEVLLHDVKIDMKVKVTPRVNLSGASDKIQEDFSSLGVTALKAACKERGLKGYSKLPKEDLISLLED